MLVKRPTTPLASAFNFVGIVTQHSERSRRGHETSHALLGASERGLPKKGGRTSRDLLSRVSDRHNVSHRSLCSSLTDPRDANEGCILCDTHRPRKGKEECSRSSDSLKFTRNTEKYLQSLCRVPPKRIVLEHLGLCQLLSTSCQSWAFLSGDERWPLPDESQPAACWELRLRRGPAGGHCFGSPSTEPAGSDTRTPGRFFRLGWESPGSLPPGH